MRRIFVGIGAVATQSEYPPLEILNGIILNCLVRKFGYKVVNWLKVLQEVRDTL